MTFLQALLRRASARTGLKKFQLAIADYEEVTKLEPRNKAAQAEKSKLEAKLEECKMDTKENKPAAAEKFEDIMKGALAKPKSDRKTTVEKLEVNANVRRDIPGSVRVREEQEQELQDDEQLVFPIDKPAHLRSKKPMKRIDIKEVDESVVKPVTAPLPKSQSSLSVASVRTGEKWCGSNTEQSNMVKSKSSGFTKKIENDISSDMSKVDIVSPIPEVPKTSSKFLIDWKSLKTVVNRCKYLQQFKVSDYPAVFKTSLDGDLFSELGRSKAQVSAIE